MHPLGTDSRETIITVWIPRDNAETYAISPAPALEFSLLNHSATLAQKQVAL